MKIKLSLLAFFAVLFGCSEQKESAEWSNLFNGENLQGWQIFGGNGKFSDENSLKAENIFSVKNGAIQVYADAKTGSKQELAVLISDKAYSRYHLQVEYRWLEGRFQPRDKANRDSGILVHAHTWLKGPWPWPPSIEMQMGDGQVGEEYVTGDLWVLGNTRVNTPQSNGKYATTGKRVEKSGADGPINNLTSIHGEKANGEWNLAEVIIDGHKSAQFILNGQLVNEVFDIEFMDKADNSWKALEQGHIVLQAEWAEVEFRSVRIKPLKSTEKNAQLAITSP